MSSPASRLDAFADAAFAFAVSLMVVGGSGTAPDYASLVSVMQSIPSFFIGFAIIAMFWFAHVRWRALRGEGDWLSVLLTLALILAVLVYIHPLRAMSASFVAFLSGNGDHYGSELPKMFAIYGAGFVVMALLTAALYRDALRNANASATVQREAMGQSYIWLILAATGMVSVIMTQLKPIAYFAPFAYASLPVTIGLFASQWRWTADEAE